MTTVRQFRKEHQELKGKRIILCEHLKNKTIDEVDMNLWTGDNSRVLLCPICYKVHAQTVWERMIKSALFLIDISKRAEYTEWLETAGKDKS